MQAAGAVVVQDVAERLRAAVEEVLVVHRIGIVAELQGAGHGGQGPRAAARGHHHGQLAKARVREAGQRLLREHEAAAAHVDREAVPERQGLPFALAAEDAGLQRGQGAAVQRRVQQRAAAGTQLHRSRRCLRAPRSWGRAGSLGPARAAARPRVAAGLSRAPAGIASHPRSPSLLAPCSFPSSPLGSCEGAAAAHRCRRAGAGSRAGAAPGGTPGGGPRRGQPRNALPVPVALPELTLFPTL
nr:uncharacterized protein LOC118971009 [Manis javanica]